MTKINIGSIAALRAKMTPGEYALDEETGAIWAFGSGELDSKADGLGLCAEHNAIPALLALARAVGELETTRTNLAVARESLQRASAEVWPAWPENPNRMIDEAYALVAKFESKLSECKAAYDAARAAVTL